MNRSLALFDCYRSGQIPEAAWQKHLAEGEVKKPPLPFAKGRA